MHIVKLIVLAVVIFAGSFAATYLFRDPPVNMSKYENVVPEYKAKIQELLVATNVLRSPIYKFRHAKALGRLEALAEENIVPEARETIYVYYAQPALFYCTKADKSCPKVNKVFDAEHSKKAYHWARKLEGKKKTAALAYLLRDARFAPVATEEDRIALMFATEEQSRTALEAAVALAYHHLDRRYFDNNMMDEALLWLNRARELEQTL